MNLQNARCNNKENARILLPIMAMGLPFLLSYSFPIDFLFVSGYTDVYLGPGVV